MPTVGRPPKPTAVKELEGNPGKRPLNEDEPKYDIIRNADPPKTLNEEAAEYWCHYAPLLGSRGVLTVADLHNLEVFCQSYADFQAAERLVIEHGMLVEGASGLKKNPALTIKNEAAARMQRFGAALGLDPSSRSRIQAPKNPEEENEFLKLLNA
ncbi:phage terminase small subunit P27 family [Marinibactrum halimedae]|uniref:Terminase n=1 Tax=Marinibactrum halimedae TaxID=1444977 RepID=A0AA37TDG6_9GAMM|nr:phage terminase small subunit P27 family [Marinibactrum halimedae]MCD9458896.1 phage terminase small subunit P27 family [Marinibactrum halimedae]GLS27745.1 terminase [Marinibactrum halimedae]